jgi:hypothetical protein
VPELVGVHPAFKLATHDDPATAVFIGWGWVVQIKDILGHGNSLEDDWCELLATPEMAP